MIIHSASQLLTITGGPQRGLELGRLGIIENGAVMIKDGEIIATGKTADLLAAYQNEPTLNAGGKVVMPGFVDPHTHLVWAGDRAAEFEMRLQGRSYMEIMTAGGGIVSTVRATRNASLADLIAQTQTRAASIFRNGTTTAEAKTGYGLDEASELLQMEALLKIDQVGPLEIIPTYLGAHAIAPEYQDDPAAYTELMVNKMLPGLKDWWAKLPDNRPLPFVDVFCEKGAFNLVETRRILECAVRLGFPIKIHADEFENLGGSSLAAELNAASADHLVKTSAADIAALAKSSTVAVSLPCTPFGLADPHYSPASAIIQQNGLLAIASDMNPGTAWCESMQFVIALACRYLRLTPAQAVAAATINAAAAIQQESRIGSLDPGKQADFIILSVPDYRNLGYRFGTNLVETVIKKGVIYPFGPSENLPKSLTLQGA